MCAGVLAYMRTVTGDEQHRPDARHSGAPQPLASETDRSALKSPGTSGQWPAADRQIGRLQQGASRVCPDRRIVACCKCRIPSSEHSGRNKRRKYARRLLNVARGAVKYIQLFWLYFSRLRSTTVTRTLVLRYLQYLYLTRDGLGNPVRYRVVFLARWSLKRPRSGSGGRGRVIESTRELLGAFTGAREGTCGLHSSQPPLCLSQWLQGAATVSSSHK